MIAEDLKIDFFLIGAQKCATSFLFYILKDHPDIIMPQKKNELGYLGGNVYKREGKEWFFERYQDTNIPSGLIVGDASVDYLFDSKSINEIKKHTREPKFIISLRNPIDRFVSGYYWFVRRNLISNIDINELFDSSTMTIKNDIQNQYINECLQRGLYDKQIKEYFENFNQKNFLIIDFEEIISNKYKVVKQIYQFLDVSPNYVPISVNKKPKINSYNNIIMEFERLSKNKVLEKLSDYINQIYTMLKKPKLILNITSREILRNYYSNSISDTIKLLKSLPTNNRPNESEFENRLKI
jgi:hypothetical protein